MCRINFVDEFRSIIAESYKASLTCQERMLWIALFYAANERAAYNGQTQTYEWPEELFTVANAELYLYCALEKRSIEAVRNRLQQKGYIRFVPGDRNRRAPAYQLFYLTRAGQESAPGAAGVGVKNAPNIDPNTGVGSENVHNFDPKNVVGVKNAPKTCPNSVPKSVPKTVPKSVPKTVPKSVPNLTKEYIDLNQEAEEGERGRAPGSFHPPTIEEVRAWCRETESRVNPDRFWAYHARTGWNVPPGYDWRADLLSWEALPYDRGRPAVGGCYTNAELARLDVDLGEATP